MNLTLSIVSHGHGESIKSLLTQINQWLNPSLQLNVIVTWNAPHLETTTADELESLSAWPIKIIINRHPRGFAENHNCALREAPPGIWCVVNPDVLIPQIDLHKITSAFSKTHVGLVYPRQLSLLNEPLDYKRELVTPWALAKRYLLPDTFSKTHIDWVSGCFMAFRSSIYQQLRGFDERFHLYCEDVDICLRLQLAGYKMAEADFSIIHDTRRGTLKQWDHFKWHVASLLKLWCSRAFWAYLWNRHKIRQR